MGWFMAQFLIWFPLQVVEGPVIIGIYGWVRRDREHCSVTSFTSLFIYDP